MQTMAYALLLAAQPVAVTTSPDPPATIPENTAGWWREYSTAVRDIGIGDARSLRLFCQGKGSPTVILESGRGNRIATWHKVQPMLGRDYRVCAYNRAGIDGSSPGPTPRDAVAIVSDLEKLIRQAELRPPFILVGHSLGGLTVRLFARRNLAAVAGIVLVDPSSEDMLERMAPISSEWVDVLRKDRDHFQRCAAEPNGHDCKLPVPDDAPPALRNKLIAQLPEEWFRATASELDSLLRADGDSAQIKAAGADVGAIPMVVLTADSIPRGLPESQRPALVAAKIAMHKIIAGHSRRGVHKLITGTSHNMQLDRPDAVVEAVKQIASMVPRSQ